MSLLERLVKVLPRIQAKHELRWIKLELPKDKWEDAVKERSKLKPLQYILGNQPFGKLDLYCHEGVLIPRSETEEWVEELNGWLANVTGPIKNVLDVGTGSGNIALALASAGRDLGDIIGMDKNIKAISLAEENKIHNRELLKGIQMFDKIRFGLGDLATGEVPNGCPPEVELVVANPPYIPKEDMNEAGGVEKSVLEYEPWDALEGDLEPYQQLVKLIEKLHSKAFVFEIGYLKQANEVRRLLPEVWRCGLRHDSAGHPRNVVGWNDKKYNTLEDMVDEILDSPKA